MKDFLIGFISGILLIIGFELWVVDIRAVGMILILLSQFLGVIVWGHYMQKGHT
jgi:hypothetical protein